MLVFLWAQVPCNDLSTPLSKKSELTHRVTRHHSFLASWFHCFDAAVILVSFFIDVASRGLTESIGSLVVVLRLWRLAKISEEVVMGATERLEILEQQVVELEDENRALRQQLDAEPHEYMSHE